MLSKLTFKTEVVTSLLEYICEYYCLNIIVNVNFFSALNIYVNNTLKYYDSQTLNEKLKSIGGAMNFFSQKVPLP